MRIEKSKAGKLNERFNSVIDGKSVNENGRIERLKESLGNGYLNESSLSRIFQHIQNDRSFGIVSASRGDLSDKENDERYLELKKSVRAIGYGYIELRGGYKEDTGVVTEPSLFIPNISRRDLLALGNQYNQESVIFKDDSGFYELDAYNGNVVKEFSRGRDWIDTSIEATKEFFSSLLKGSHAGRKFVFKGNESFILEEKEVNSLSRARLVHYGYKPPVQWFRIYGSL